MKKLIPPYIRVLFIFFSVLGLMEYFIDSGDRPAFIKYPMVAVFLFVLLFLLIAIEITLKAVDTITYQLLSDEEKAKQAYEDSLSLKDKSWYKNLMQRLTKTVSVED